jgi:hypothetical protein
MLVILTVADADALYSLSIVNPIIVRIKSTSRLYFIIVRVWLVAGFWGRISHHQPPMPRVKDCGLIGFWNS